MPRSSIPLKTKTCKICGNERRIFSKGRCGYCTPKKPINKRSKKKVQEIKESNDYYERAIQENRDKHNGENKCDECRSPIPSASGRNVCHILSGGANKSAYPDPENHYFLGFQVKGDPCNCGDVFDNSKRQTELKIWPESRERLSMLKQKYR